MCRVFPARFLGDSRDATLPTRIIQCTHDCWVISITYDISDAEMCAFAARFEVDDSVPGTVSFLIPFEMCDPFFRVAKESLVHAWAMSPLSLVIDPTHQVSYGRSDLKDDVAFLQQFLDDLRMPRTLRDYVCAPNRKSLLRRAVVGTDSASSLYV